MGQAMGRAHRRRLVAVVAALACTAGVAACGGGSDGGSDGGDVTLTFWTHTHPPMIELNKTLIAQYEKANPNVTVEYQTIPNTEFGTKMLTALSNGTGPDVINMDDNALRGEYIPKNLLAPVDPKAFGKGSVEELEKGYAAGVLDGAKDAKGTLYGVPSELNSTAFAINTKHFRDAGLDPKKPPKTWDEVSAYGKKLVAAGHGQSFNFNYIHSGWYSQMYQTLLNQTGGSIANGSCDKATVNQPKSVATMQIWADLARNDKIADPHKASREATAPYQDLATGKQSMAIVYPWSMPQIADSNPDVYKDLSVVPLPQVDVAKPVIRWYGYDWAVNKASEEQEAAWKFIAFLSTKHDAWLSDVGFIQGQQGWTESKPAKELDDYDTWAKAYTNGKFDQVCPHWSEVQDALKAAIDKVVFDGVAPQRALDQANTQIQSSIE
ncbi:MAG: extracellular solute-binding protein [Streptosporangiales bacterium]|nr:extracellular solute-binding protein [Streptosporangiales bacterium]